MGRRYRLVVSLALVLLAAADVRARTWCPLSERACGVPGLPSAVVDGIIHVESSGQPLAIGLGMGARHRGFFPATRMQARVLLRMVLSFKERANVGIGLMQVNWLWWQDELRREMGIEALDLFDPKVNLEAGCLILRRALLESSGTLEQRLGRYHSWHPERGLPYAQRVLAEAWRLEQEAGHGEQYRRQMQSLRARLKR